MDTSYIGKMKMGKPCVKTWLRELDNEDYAKKLMGPL